MAAPPQPTRFAIQRAKGKGWKTIFVDERIAAVESTLTEMIRINPKGCFRLIRLDHNPEAEFDGLEFNWKLIALHAPAAGQIFTGSTGLAPAPPSAPVPARTKKPRPEPVAVPYLVYGLVIILGALIAVATYLKLGPAPG